MCKVGMARALKRLLRFLWLPMKCLSHTFILGYISSTAKFLSCFPHSSTHTLNCSGNLTGFGKLWTVRPEKINNKIKMCINIIMKRWLLLKLPKLAFKSSVGNLLPCYQPCKVTSWNYCTKQYKYRRTKKYPCIGDITSWK